MNKTQRAVSMSPAAGRGRGGDRDETGWVTGSGASHAAWARRRRVGLGPSVVEDIYIYRFRLWDELRPVVYLRFALGILHSNL